MKNSLKYKCGNSGDLGMRHSTTGITQGVEEGVTKLHSKTEAGKKLGKLL